MQLTQQETNKIKQRDEQHTQELREWRSELGKRKQVSVYISVFTLYTCMYFSYQKLEDEFRRVREEQERFFSEDRALPMSLKTSFSLPQVSREQRALRTTSLPSQPAHWATPPPGQSIERQSSLNTLDEVVLGLPTMEDLVDNS